MTTKNEFAIARELFASYVKYVNPLSYDEWLSVADDCKAAVLYCQFYDQITLAWYKLKSVYSNEADGVDEVLQYLQKNVDVIKKNSARFSGAYIYRVAYNCLYCLCRDPNRYKAAYENEISNITCASDGSMLDMFDFIPSFDDMDSNKKRRLSAMVWDILDAEVARMEAEGVGSGKQFAIVVSELLEDNLDWTGFYHKFDFPNGQPEKKKYKHVDEVSIKNLASKKAEIISKYGNSIVDGIECVPAKRNGVDIYKLVYHVVEDRQYKGVQEFTKKERESVTEEVKAAMLEILRRILAPCYNMMND